MSEQIFKVDIHPKIDFLSNPSLAGLPDTCTGMGVIRGSEPDSGRRSTMLVDHDYALMMLEAQKTLTGFMPLTTEVVRWVRLGWPEEWGDPKLPTIWLPVYVHAGSTK